MSFGCLQKDFSFRTYSYFLCRTLEVFLFDISKMNVHYLDLPIHKCAYALFINGEHMQGWQCCVRAGSRDLAVLGHQQKNPGCIN